MNKREMSVAGIFYPAQCSEINRYIRTFSEGVEFKTELGFRPRAIISPHAGYVYSGFTANTAYCLIDTAGIKRVLVIGPSHRVYIRGASVALHAAYASPCGELKMDQEYAKSLIDRHDTLSFEPSAHKEHSTETQVPFIQHYFGEVSLVEIVYGDIDYRDLIPIIADALSGEDTFVVISTDLSHFYDLEDANRLDSVCLKAVEKMDVEGLNAGCEACGMIGVKAVLTAAKRAGMQSRLIDYRTSYDASRDANSVVGYMSVLLG